MSYFYVVDRYHTYDNGKALASHWFFDNKHVLGAHTLQDVLNIIGDKLNIVSMTQTSQKMYSITTWTISK